MDKKDIKPKEDIEEIKNIEANMFALNLLLPKGMFLEAIYKHRQEPDISDSEVVTKIAEEFEVEEIVVCMRMASLGLFKIMYKKHTPFEEQLKKFREKGDK